MAELLDPWAPNTDYYQSIECLGSGATGIVYKGINRRNDQVVALKTLKFIAPDDLLRFKAEFRIASNIYHPNLAQLYELILDDEEAQFFFSMELIDGRDFVQAARRSPASASADIAASIDYDAFRMSLGQLFDGLEALHLAGIEHRDIKPSNVLVERDGRTVILDFGLSIGTTQVGTTVTTSLKTAGTPAYMAPERLSGKPPTPESDWFSVGVMLYQTLTDKHPFVSFNEKSPVTFYEAQRLRRQNPPSPGDFNHAVPDDLNTLVRELLRWNSGDRPTAVYRQRFLRKISRATQVDPVAIGIRTGPQMFVGREAELAALERSLADSRKDGARVVRVTGAAGVGKSALIERFLAEAFADDDNSPDTLVLRSRCHRRENIQFRALDGLVDNLSYFLSRRPSISAAAKPGDVPALVKMFPVLARVPFDRDGRLSRDPHVNLRRAFRALSSLVRRIAAAQPLVVWIDDFQWSDAASIPFLRRLIIESAGEPGPLIIISHRAGEADDALASLLGSDCDDFTSEVLRLSTLSGAESRELFARFLRMSETEQDVSQLAEEAGGLPLFVLELAQHYRRFSVDRDIARRGPRTFESVLRERVESLPSAHRSLLQIVAVARRPLPDALLERLMTSSASRSGAIFTLCRENLLRRTSSGGRPSVESFHEDIRQVLLPERESGERVKLHRIIAEGIESFAGASDVNGEPDENIQDVDYEMLVEHFAGAGDNQKVAAYALIAARRAEERLSFERASEHFELALTLRDRGEADWGIRGELAESLANAGRPIDSGTQYLNVGAAMERIGIESASQRKRWVSRTGEKARAAEQFMYAASLTTGLRLLKEVFAELQLPLPGRRRFLTLLALMNRLRALPYLTGLRRFDVRKRRGDLSNEQMLRMESLWIAAKGMIMLDYALGDVLVSRYYREALQLGERSLAIRAIGLEASVYANIGRWGLAELSESMMKRAEELCLQSDDPYDSAMLGICKTTREWCRGRWSECAKPAREAMAALHECEGTNFDVAIVQGFALSARVFLGDLQGVRDTVDGLIENAERRGDRYFVNVFQSGYLVFLHLADDDPDLAIEAAAATLSDAPSDRFSSLHFHHFNATANALLYAGRTGEAWDFVTHEWPRVSQANFPRLSCIGAHMREIRARAAIALADDLRFRSGPVRSTPRGLLRIAVHEARAIERRPLPHSAALAAVIRAGSAAVRRDRETQRDALVSAVNGFARNDVCMALHAEAARLQLARVDEDAESAESVRQRMRGRGIRNPDAMADTLIPGQR